MCNTTSRQSRLARSGALFLLGFILVTANLRPAVTSVPVVLPELARYLKIGPVAQTWLVTAPLACFCLVALTVPWLVRRFGEERLIFGAVVFVLVGTLLRTVWAVGGLFAGTVIASSGIGTLNVVLSSLIKRRAPHRAGVLIGMYLLMLYVGAMAGSGLSVPLMRMEHGSVLESLRTWAVLAGIALVAWTPQLGRRCEWTMRRETKRPRNLGSTVWRLAGFMGTQNIVYYATVSFLPILFRGRGASALHAGFLVSLTSVGGLATVLIVPVVVHRWECGRLLVVPTALITGCGIVAALVAPMSSEAVWMLLLGASEGSALALAISLTVSQATNAEASVRLSGASQSVGYGLAAGGLFLTGLLHEVTRGWGVPVAVLVVLCGMELAFGWLSVRAGAVV